MKIAALTIPKAARLFALVGACAAVLLLLGCGSSGDEGTTPVAAAAAPSAEKPAATPSQIAPSANSTPAAPTEVAQTETPAAAQPSPTPPTPTATAVPPTATPVPPAFSILIASGSEARYRVKEQLAGRNFPNDAVGVTQDVIGSIAFDEEGGLIADQSKISVDVSTIESDDNRRDRYVRNNSLESNRFPIALFEARATKGLSWPLPTSGEAAFQLLGEMTVHGVAKPLTWEVTAQFGEGGVTVQAVTSFTFGYFNMTIPRAFIVVSVEDNVQLELDINATVETGG